MNPASWLDPLRLSATRAAWTDVAVFTVLLAATNALISPQDFGWLLVQPSPWILLPLLIGGRHGFVPGVGAGLAPTLLVPIGQAIAHDISPASTLAHHSLFFAGLVVVGAAAGELQSAARRRNLQLSAQNTQLAQRLRQLDAELSVVRESKLELERMLATLDSDLSTLDGEMRRLISSEGHELYQNLLLLLQRQARVTDAALYLIDGNQLKRAALIGQHPSLPETLDPHSSPMLETALAQRVPVSIPDFWHTTTQTAPSYLAVLPLPYQQDRVAGLVVVAQMPFIALTRRSLQTMSLICRWTGGILEAQLHAEGTYRVVPTHPPQKIYFPHYFRRTLELAHASFQLHRLPSSVVRFTPLPSSSTDQTLLEQALLPTIRFGDYPAVLDLPSPNLVVLLSLTPERGAHIFRDRLSELWTKHAPSQPPLQTKIILFDPAEDADQLWNRILLP